MPGLPDTPELSEQKLRRYADVVVSALEEGKGTPPWGEGNGPQSNESVQASALLARAIQAHSPAEQELLLSRISENLNVTGGDPTGAESIYHTVQALNAAASAMRRWECFFRNSGGWQELVPAGGAPQRGQRRRTCR